MDAAAFTTPDGELRPLEEVERSAIEFAIQACAGNMSEVARRLGIGRSTLYRKIAQYERSALTTSQGSPYQDGASSTGRANVQSSP